MSKHMMIIFDDAASDSVSDALCAVIEKWADVNDVPMAVMSTGDLKSPFMISFPWDFTKILPYERGKE